MTTWREERKKMDSERIAAILSDNEKSLIGSMVKIRTEQGLSQARLAGLCGVKQPVIARMEKSVHSPQISSLLKVLEPMGYTLKIVPMEDGTRS